MGLFRKLVPAREEKKTPENQQAIGGNPPPPASGAPSSPTLPKENPLPQTPPAEAPPTPPETSPEEEKKIQELTEQVSSLTKTLETERESMKGFTDKVKGMEGRMKSLQNLSELLSMKYNPFLSDSKEEPFEGKLPLLDDLIPKGATNPPSTNGNGTGSEKEAPLHICDENCQTHRKEAEAIPPPSESTASIDGPMGGNAAAFPSPTSNPPLASPGSPSEIKGGGNGTQHAIEIVSVASLPRVEELRASPAPAAPIVELPRPNNAPTTPSPPAAPALRVPPPRPPQPLRSSEPSPAGYGFGFGLPRPGTRESYLALSWFEYLVSSVEAKSIYFILDYYQDVGWLSSEAHEWFCRLAQGVAPRPSQDVPATLSSDPHKLIELHKASLRFLDHLFRTHLYKGEAHQLEQTAQALLEIAR